MNGCTCEWKEQMINEMLEMRKKNPNHENRWVPLLFPDSREQAPCCLLTFLFYYAYCEECTRSLSDVARTTLKPLMDPEE